MPHDAAIVAASNECPHSREIDTLARKVTRIERALTGSADGDGEFAQEKGLLYRVGRMESFLAKILGLMAVLGTPAALYFGARMIEIFGLKEVTP